MTSTDAVVPARNLTVSGSLSRYTTIGMRCASRIHSKVGLMEGSNWKPVLPFVCAIPQPMLSTLPCKGCIGIAHQRDDRAISDLDIADERFPEECLDIEAIRFDHSHYRLIGYRRISGPQLQIGDVSILGRRYRREIQVLLSKFQVRLSPAQPGVGFSQDAKIGFRTSQIGSRSLEVSCRLVHVRSGTAQPSHGHLIFGVPVVVFPLIAEPRLN